MLIPRPETEQLVDLAFERIRSLLTGAPRPAAAPPVRAWDVATGSGAVVVALAALLRRRGYLDEVELTGQRPLAPTRSRWRSRTWSRTAVADRVTLARGDLLDIPDRVPVDVLTGQPAVHPERTSCRACRAEVRAEPALALDGGPDGMDLLRRLLAGLPDVLLPGGIAFLEMGADQADLMTAGGRPPARQLDRRAASRPGRPAAHRRGSGGRRGR